MPQPTVTAAALIIGNEILSGRTQDVNLAFLARRLNELGIRLMEARVVADEEEAIVAAVNETRARFDYVFTTGGIGPTHDDITASSVARAFAVPLIQNPEARAILESFYAPGDLNTARLRMANTPQGATLIENPVSRAPGFQIGNVFVMAGVPSIMQAMFEGCAHRLSGGQPLRSRSLSVDLPEGGVAQGLAELQQRHGEVEIGSYPFNRDGRLGVRLVLRSTAADALEAAARELESLVDGLGGVRRWDEA